MLVLITCWDNRVYIFRISIEQLVTICLVLNLELFDSVFSFITNKYVKKNKIVEAINIFIHSLRFVSDLNLTIFIERVLLSKITSFKATYSLVFLHIENSSSKVSILHNYIPLVVFKINSRIGWRCEYWVNFTFS